MGESESLSGYLSTEQTDAFLCKNAVQLLATCIIILKPFIIAWHRMYNPCSDNLLFCLL